MKSLTSIKCDECLVDFETEGKSLYSVTRTTRTDDPGPESLVETREWYVCPNCGSRVYTKREDRKCVVRW